MVKGLHHVSMRCGTAEAFQRAKDFYCGILGLPVWREWPAGVLIDTGNGLIEIFNNGAGETRPGAIRHVALADSDVDATVEKVRRAGYEILTEPKDISIGPEPGYPARIAFCAGPLGEELELFQER